MSRNLKKKIYKMNLILVCSAVLLASCSKKQEEKEKTSTKKFEFVEKENKYTTFFFEEYERMAEKNTFSAFLPNRNKGLWCMSRVDSLKKNLAKTAVVKVVEEYLKNDSFSVENINKFLNEAIKELWTNISENRNKMENISILTVMIEGNKLIAGNVGRNKLKIFRENKLFEELNGDKIKEVILKENDYILIGTETFWKLINEYEICEMLEKFKDRNVVEETLSLKIKKEEKDKKSVIPFLSILVENLKDEEIAVSYDQYRDVGYRNPLGFLMVMMIFLFFFMATGKQIKYSENIGNIKNNLEITETTPIKLKERKLLKAENIIETEKIDTEYSENIDMGKIDKIEENKDKEITKNRRQKNIRKNSGKKMKIGRMKENSNIESLEKEIQKNWEILGRDSNGNKKLEKE